MISLIIALCQLVTIVWVIGVVMIFLWLALTGQLCGLLREMRRSR